jgi:succinate dehydrogenase / fumarate reductase, cytochrome b subunit
MATTTGARAYALLDNAIGKKTLVAVTGAILFGFVVAHLAGNMLVLLGEEALNDYGALLHAIPELLWMARIVLLASVITHIVLSIQIARQARAARSVPYRAYVDGTQQSILQSYARKTMIISGPVVGAYIVFHLLHLTVGADVVPGYTFEEGQVYANFVHGFRVPWITAIYLFANTLLGLHLFHGGQALFQTLGLRHPQWDKRTRPLAFGLATFITVGNTALPLLTLARVIGADVP